jgi:hypothetical protein
MDNPIPAWMWVGMAFMAVGSIVAVIWLASSAVKEGIETPAPTIQFVSGTEYNLREQGQVIVEIRDIVGDPVQSNCTISVWYPDKSSFILNQPTNLSSSGNSYIEFQVPNVTGVYEYQANCTAMGRRMVISKSFHASEFQNETWTTLHRIKAVTPK